MPTGASSLRREAASPAPSPPVFFCPLPELLRCRFGAGRGICFDANLSPSPSLNGVLHPVAGHLGGRYHCARRGSSEASLGQALGSFEKGCV